MLTAHDNNRDTLFFGFSDNLVQYIYSALIRQQNVQQNQIRSALIKELKPALRRHRNINIISLLLQRFPQKSNKLHIVIY
ncbi:hypothetical protein D3C86_1746690 [compost metagenome]